MTIVFGGAACGGIIGCAASESTNEDEAFWSPGGEHLVRVAFDLDLAPDLSDRSGLVDQERRPLDPEILSAVHVLPFPHVVCGRHTSVIVAEQREVQVVLVLEFHMALRVVAAHAEDDRSLRRDASKVVAETARFLRATGRVVFRVEIEDDFLAAEVFQGDLLSAVRGQREVRRPFAYPQHRRTATTHATARFNVTDSSNHPAEDRKARLCPI